MRAFALVNSLSFTGAEILCVRRGELLVQDVAGRNTEAFFFSVWSHLIQLLGWCVGSWAKGCLFYMTLGAVWNSFQIQWLVPQKASQKLLSHLSVIALAFMGRLWRTSAIRAAGVVSRQALRLSASGMEICLWSFKLLSVYLWRPCLFSKATCLVSKLAEENPPFFPSCFLHVLQSDINHVLFFFPRSPKKCRFHFIENDKIAGNLFPSSFLLQNNVM